MAIKNLIRFFRLHAYPDGVPPDEEFSIALNYPNMFKIKLQSGVGGTFKNIGVPIKYCYLRNISHVYNSTTPVLHPDGAPMEVDLNLTFTEYKTLRRRDIKMEDNDVAFDKEQTSESEMERMQKAFKYGRSGPNAPQYAIDGGIAQGSTPPGGDSRLAKRQKAIALAKGYGLGPEGL